MQRKEMIDRIYNLVSDWHPVMIGDVIQYMSDRMMNYYDVQLSIIRIRDLYKQPIEDQPDECIEYVYNLFNNTNKYL